MVDRGAIVFGVATGSGEFRDRFITPEQTSQLQQDPPTSHAVGVGLPLPEPVLRARMLIPATPWTKRFSGIRLETLRALFALLNRGVHPVIPAQGSLGASGDLAPRARIALVFIGQGEADSRRPGA